MKAPASVKKAIGILAIALGLISCQPEGRIYSEHKELSPDLEWLKKDSREFEIPITDQSLTYNLSLSFRYATGYQYQTANVKVTETSPSGVETTSEHVLKIRGENGDYLGEAGLDIWDSEHLIEAQKQYSESGTYTYTIEHNMPADPLNYAMEIGIVVDKAVE